MDDNLPKSISSIRADLHEMRKSLEHTAKLQQGCHLRWLEIARAMEHIKFWLACLAILIVLVPAIMEVIK